MEDNRTENNNIILEYENLIRSIERDFDKEDLIGFINSTKLYEMPANLYTRKEELGLIKHMLSVYYSMLDIAERRCIQINNDSVIIVALFHELFKHDFYILDVVNCKEYRNDGDKVDSVGRYKWVSKLDYKYNQETQSVGIRTLENVRLLRQFINLTKEEEEALIYCDTSVISKEDLSKLLSRNKLLLLLHCADLLDTYER